jgi:F420-dependent oxidoreductase-like protein
MELAIKIAPHHITWDTMLRVAGHADESGVYEQFWNFDHFYPIKGDTSGPCLESWVTLTAIAQATSRIRMGSMVNGIHHRHPAVVANMASAIDIVSGGRFELGLGAGWNEEESDAYGIELGSLRERFDRLDEGLEVLVGLLAEEETTFHGRYYQLTNARNDPKGPQLPLPICIGGTGERRTLRSVARYASHWNLPMFDGETLRRKLDVLAGHCADAGTDVDAIKVSTHVFAPADADPAELVGAAEEQAEAGIDQAIVYFEPPVDLATVESVTQAMADGLG